MKRLGFTVFAAAVLALPVCAQVATTVRADIPFEFVVGNTTAAPGTYVIRVQAGSPMVELAGSRSYYLQTSLNSPYTGPQEAKLVFHRYGGQYFPSQIWIGSRSLNFSMSRTERELKKTAAAAGQTQIVLAMR